MNLKRPIFLSVVAVVGLVVAAFFPRFDSSEKESLLLQTILEIAQYYHFDPQQINDDFSEKVYDLYLDRVDRGKRWLTQSDVDELMAYKAQLDDQAKEGSYAFFDLSVKLLEQGIEKSQSYYQEILAEPFSFDLNETIELDSEKKSFAASDDELKERWRKSLKYEVMTRLAGMIEEQNQAKDSEIGEQQSVEELEVKAREKVLDLYESWYKRMAKLERSDRLTTYLNTITNVFDPHTGYFEPVQKQSFDIEFGGRLEGIGARLQEDDDFTKVSSIVVGGPAWKTKQLDEGDLIIKVAQGDDGEPLDIKGMRVDEVVQYIRGKKGTKVRLTVKKVDGTINEVPIVRDIIVLEERFAKSLILEDEGKEKVGYLYLPGFYADFNDKNGHFSSADVAVELEKLKKDNVKGVILDLRDNGGGALEEVRKMSGLFIEEGPIVQVKSKDRRAEVLKDTDARVQYDGPLIVLVNNFSASASEILADALQDYGRAVIVGSKKTHGKGTVQRFIDLDRMLRGNAEVKPLGHIKLTMQKYYGVDGGSVQLDGVTPDIILPDYLHYVTTGERDYDHALEWSEIEAVPFEQNVYQIHNLEELRKLSEDRIANDETFQAILERAAFVKAQRDETVYPLSLTAYQALEKERDEESKEYRDLMKEEYLSNVSNLTVDLSDLETADESKIARNEDFIKSVKKDIYLKEAIAIMNDMIATHDLAKK